MKLITTAIVLAGALILSAPAEANDYKRGNHRCGDFSYAVKEYKKNPDDPSDQTLYGVCLVIKGDDAQGLPMLYHLCDHQSWLKACFFLAEYLETDGRFDGSITKKTLDEAIKYYFRTLALIRLIPTYPEPDFWAHEIAEQIELNSLYTVPILYLYKYELGAVGDYCKRALRSGESKTCTPYPKHDRLMTDSLRNMLRYARECAATPEKRHFKTKRYNFVSQACSMMETLAGTLMPLEQERQNILLKPSCENLTKESCPEYWKSHQGIWDLIEEHEKKKKQVFDSVFGRS